MVSEAQRSMALNDTPVGVMDRVWRSSRRWRLRPGRAAGRLVRRPRGADGGPRPGRLSGTSLTAGLGLDPSEAYPALLQQKIDSAGLQFTTVNAGVSGETSAGARRRIDWMLRQPAAVLVIETGANDGLRGLDVDSMQPTSRRSSTARGSSRPRRASCWSACEAPPNYGSATPGDSGRSIPSSPSANGCRWCRSCSRAWRGRIRSTRRT